MVSPREQASQRIRAVETALSDARAKWSGWSVSIGSYFGSPKDQVLGAISQIESLGVAPWKARANKLAATDQAGWDRWIRDGNDMLANLASTAQEASAATLQAITAETVKATAVTVARAAKKTATVAATVAKEAWDFRYLAVVGLLAVAGLILYARFAR